MNRREFLKRGTGALALAGTGLSISGADEIAKLDAGSGHKRSLKKGIMWSTVGLRGTMLEKMQAIKAAGFDGVEMNSHMKVEDVLHARNESGLLIPSVCCAHHWQKPLSHPDPRVREESLESLKQALRDAKAYGASSVLFVCAVVNKEVSYAEAYKRAQEGIHKAIPLAEELDVKIACENVWNHFLLSPLEAARFVDEFKSPAVGWHFDVGNVLASGWPEQWIRVLGKRIQKLHIKEYSRKKQETEGPRKGFDVDYLEGDNDWPAVMRALDEIGYNGWGTAEQRGADSAEGLKKLSEGMDKIFAS
jgi:L-ribulose-5-phosphate 3-epimerase